MMNSNFSVSEQDIAKLRRASELDNESFSKLLFAVTRALGASDRQISMMMSSPGAIRSMIAKASDRDLRSLAGRIGKEKTSEILGIIDGALSEQKT